MGGVYDGHEWVGGVYDGHEWVGGVYDGHEWVGGVYDGYEWVVFQSHRHVPVVSRLVDNAAMDEALAFKKSNCTSGYELYTLVGGREAQGGVSFLI